MPFDHPLDPESGRFLCSPERPMPAGRPKGSLWSHTSATETDRDRDFGGGEYCVEMHCPDCGAKWWRELPQ